MAFNWGEIIRVAVPFVVDFFTGGDDAEAGAQPEGKKKLVAKPPPELEESEGPRPWSPTARFSNINSSAARPVGATAALRSASPSEVNSRYWAAIYSDAKRRSEIR